MGMIITIPDIKGSPLLVDGNITDPLQATSYTIHYKGKQYVDCQTTISFGKPGAKKWFDGTRLNHIKSK